MLSFLIFILKIKLEKVLVELADTANYNKSVECSLQLLQDKLKHLTELNEQQKNDSQQLVKSVDEQRCLISEMESKLQVCINIQL